jgi:indolepyruvate ferredoxin oxidoreductase, alpha subunit
MKREAPSVVIARRPCVLREKSRSFFPLKVIHEACNNCGLCLKLACPALVKREGRVVVLADSCTGCGICARVCMQHAIAE